VEIPHSGLAHIYAGREAARFFGVPVSDPRHPDVFGRVQVGVVYTTGSKIAEHGGDNPDDRDVPILVWAPGTVRPGSASRALVEFIDILPTVLDLCGVAIPSNVQGRSLRELLTGGATTHRQQVFIEYAPNDEAAVRDERWKLIFEGGQRRRTDGYDPGLPLPGRKIRLYDLETDPHELTDVASRPENAERVQHMLTLLAEHLRATARVSLPATHSSTAKSGSSNLLEQLDELVRPHDVKATTAR